MPAMSPERSKLRSQIANAVKVGCSAVEVRQLRTDYAAEKLADYIKSVVDEAPLLSAEQRDRLALLLRSDAS